MKNLIAILLLLVVSSAMAQDYTAIHVIGKIYMPEKKAFMQRGDKISEDEKLQFQSDDAKAAMLSSSKGRYVIQPGENGAKADNNLTFALKSIITPAKGQMSTRAGGINNKLDFQKQLGDAPVAWISESIEVEVSPISYPTDDDRFFYVSYNYNEESINKMLKTDQNKISFIKSELFSIDGKAIPFVGISTMELYYYNAATEEADFITPLNLVPVSDKEIASLASSIPSEIAGDEKIQMVYDYIHSLYGKCDMKTVSQAVKALN